MTWGCRSSWHASQPSRWNIQPQVAGPKPAQHPSENCANTSSSSPKTIGFAARSTEARIFGATSARRVSRSRPTESCDCNRPSAENRRRHSGWTLAAGQSWTSACARGWRKRRETPERESTAASQASSSSFSGHHGRQRLGWPHTNAEPLRGSPLPGSCPDISYVESWSEAGGAAGVDRMYETATTALPSFWPIRAIPSIPAPVYADLLTQTLWDAATAQPPEQTCGQMAARACLISAAGANLLACIRMCGPSCQSYMRGHVEWYVGRVRAGTTPGACLVNCRVTSECNCYRKPTEWDKSRRIIAVQSPPPRPQVP